MTNMKKDKLTLDEVEVASLTAKAGATIYIWEEGQEEMDYVEKLARDTAAHPADQFKRLSGVVQGYGGSQPFLFWVCDCFDPPVFLVFGDSFEDAYATFICDCEHLIKIEEPDLKDYSEDELSYNDNGTAVDTEGVQGRPVDELRIVVKPQKGRA